MVVQLDVANEAAIVPAVRQVDNGFAAIVDVLVENNVFNFAVAEVAL